MITITTTIILIMLFFMTITSKIANNNKFSKAKTIQTSPRIVGVKICRRRERFGNISLRETVKERMK